MNLKIDITPADFSANFRLVVQAYDENGRPQATIADLNVDDPILGERLRDIFQAYRMGTRYGKENPPPEKNDDGSTHICTGLCD